MSACDPSRPGRTPARVTLSSDYLSPAGAPDVAGLAASGGESPAFVAGFALAGSTGLAATFSPVVAAGLAGAGAALASGAGGAGVDFAAGLPGAEDAVAAGFAAAEVVGGDAVFAAVGVALAAGVGVAFDAAEVVGLDAVFFAAGGFGFAAGLGWVGASAAASDAAEAFGFAAARGFGFVAVALPAAFAVDDFGAPFAPAFGAGFRPAAGLRSFSSPWRRPKFASGCRCQPLPG